MDRFFTRLTGLLLQLTLLLGAMLMYLEVDATHLAGGYLRVECVGNNQYRIVLVRYRDASGVSLPNQFTIHYDPVIASEGTDRTTTAYRTSVITMDIEKTGPCHSPPEGNKVYERHIYKTPPITLAPAPGGYNIYSEEAFARNKDIINIQNSGGVAQTIFFRSSDRTEFPCNNSPKFKNAPPVEICVDDTLQFDYSALDHDGGLDTSTLKIVLAPSHGSVNINPGTGKIAYTPTSGYVGLDSFSYQLCDRSYYGSKCDEAKVYVDVAYNNLKPQATNDYMFTNEKSTIDTNLLANDIDFDGILNPFSVKVIQNPAHGDIYLLANASISYSPKGDFTGIDSFTYSVCDVGNPMLCDTATAYVSVAAALEPPLAVDDYFSVNGNTAILDIAANDKAFFANLDISTIKVLEQPNYASATALGADIFYSLNGSRSGLDTLKYLICNDQTPKSCDSATVYLALSASNFPPRALNDTARVPFNAPKIIDVVKNDRDKNDPLDNTNLSIAQDPFYGTVSVETNGIEYIPWSGFYGLDSFSYKICDGNSPEYCDEAVVYITIRKDNFRPFALTDYYIIDPGQLIPDSLLVINNDFDRDGVLGINCTNPYYSDTTYRDSIIFDQSMRGDLEPDTTEMLANGIDSFDIGSNVINAYDIDTSFSYDSIEVYDTTSLSPLVVDTSMNYDTSITTIASKVDQITYYELINDSSYRNLFQIDSTFEDTLQLVDELVNLICPGAINIIRGPQNGSVSNGYPLYYQPEEEFSGLDSIYYEICDDAIPTKCDTGLVLLFVKSENFTPFLGVDTLLPYCNAPAVINVLANDNVLLGDFNLNSLSIVQSPSHGIVSKSSDSTFIYQADSVYFGIDSFAYTVCDLNGACDTTMVFVNVDAINIPPILREQTGSIAMNGVAIFDLMKESFDIDGSIVPNSLAIADQPNHGDLYFASGGGVAYEPDPGFFGVDSFTYKLGDNGVPAKFSKATIVIEVGVKQPTQAIADTFTMGLFHPRVLDVLKNDLITTGKIDRNTLSLRTSAKYGDVIINEESNLVYQPNDSSLTGVDSFTYSICSNSNPRKCDSAIVYVISDYNEAPDASDTVLQVEYGKPRFFNPIANDSDEEGALKYGSTVITKAPDSGEVFVMGDTGMIYIPNEGFKGVDSFEYQICDEGMPVYCSKAMVTLIVSNNQPPQAQNDQFNTRFNAPVIIDVTKNDSDPNNDLDTLSVRVINLPSNGEIAYNDRGNIIYQPASDYFGVDSLVYEVSDMANPTNTDMAKAYLNVGYDPTFPLAATDNYSVNENVYDLYSIVANDDPSVDYSTMKILDYVQNGEALIQPDGKLYYFPDTNFTGLDSLRYVVCQSPLRYKCDTAAVNFVINNNDYPATANDDQVNVYADHYRYIHVLENDFDRDRSNSSSSINITQAPSNGAAVVKGDLIYYTPTPGFTGSDVLEYELCDNLGCDKATVNINVVTEENIAPVALNDRTTINKGNSSQIAVIANDYDSDRDSLSYKLCSALSNTSPYNRTQLPPFPIVPYAPPYSGTYPIASNPPLEIGSHTGLLTGVPTQTGAFVITVCVEEYKNGKFIGETRSEIQINIVNCTKQPVADIEGDPDPQEDLILSCDDKTIEFTNTSLNSTNYYWDFGVPGVISDTSTADNPVFTYPDTGTYTATLIAEPGAACESIDSVLVRIYNSPKADFTYNAPLCKDQPVLFKDDSDPVNGDIVYWQWNVDGSFKIGKNIAMAGFSTSGMKNVNLKIANNRGCQGEITKSIEVHPSPTITLPSINTICINDTVTIKGNSSGASKIEWSPNKNVIRTNDQDIVKVHRNTTGGKLYRVTASNQFGCEVDTQTVVNANPLPQIDAGGPLRLCAQSSVNINLSNTGLMFAPHFSWEPSAGLSDTTVANPLASPSENTTYTVTLSKDSGKFCRVTDTLSVITDVPTLDINSDKSVLCTEDYTQLSAKTSAKQASFNWSPGASLSDSTSQFPLASPNRTITYTLTMYDSVSTCEVTKTITLHVQQSSGLNAGKDTLICEGDTAQLTASNGSRFVWKQDTTLSCLCCKLPKAFPEEETIYTLTGIDTNGCKATDSVKVSIAPKPDFEAKKDTVVCPGEQVRIEVSGASSYIWYNDTSANCSNCSSFEVIATDSISYIIGGVSDTGCIVLDTVKVDVFPPPETASSSPPTICKGDSTQLELTGAQTYTWSPDSSLDNAGIANPIVFPDVSTNYIVEGVDTNGCNYSDTILVEVNSLNAGTFIGDSAICIGDSLRLFAKDWADYQWAPDSTITCDTCPDPIAFPSVKTTYHAYVADSNGCKDTGTVTVDVNPLPQIELTIPQDTLCVGESVQFNASGGSIYNWLPADGLSDPSISKPVATPKNDISYTLTVTDQNGCQNDTIQPIVVHQLPSTNAGPDTAICFEDTIQLSATGADSFTWSGSNGQYITCTDCPDPVVAPINTTEYTVTGYNQFGCSYKDTIEVKVNPDPDDIDISADTIICAGDSAQLFVSGGSRYEWNPSPSLSCSSCDMPVAKPTDTELFSVQVFTEKGCYRYFDVEVAVRELPEASVTADTALCLGNNITLEASGASNFEWMPQQGLRAPDIANPEASPVTPTNYTVKVSDELGCFDTDSVFVDVYIPADPNAQPDTVICINQLLKVSAENGVTYQWMPAEVFDDPTSASPTTTLTASQEMIVEITDSNGCYNADTIYAEVKGNPDFSLTEDVKIYEGTSTVLQIQGNDSYTWNPLVGIIDTGQNYIQVQPEDTVEYIVTATTAFGCVAYDSVEVTPIPRLEMYLPNAFTPNNDGKNDYFRIKSNDEFEALSLQIYDRWGNLIHTTDDPYHGWDGTVGGEPMPIGTYVYVLEVEDQLGNRQEYQGNVTLIR